MRQKQHQATMSIMQQEEKRLIAFKAFLSQTWALFSTHIAVFAQFQCGFDLKYLKNICKYHSRDSVRSFKSINYELKSIQSMKVD